MFEDIITTGFTISTALSGTQMERNMLERNGNDGETTTQNANTFPELNSNNLPPLWFKEYMEQLKKDIVKEVTSEVTKNVLEALDKGATDSVHSNCPFKRHIQYTYNLRLEKKKHKKKRATKESKDVEVPTEYNQNDSSLIKSMVKEVNQMQKVVEDAHKDLLMRMERTDKYLSRINGKEQEEENPTDQKIVDLMHVCNMNVPPSQAASSEPCNARTKQVENNLSNASYYKGAELRMNCCLTAHQMLDECCFKEDEEYNESDIDKISICSDHVILDLNDDHNFEMIQVPLSCDANNSNRDGSTCEVHETRSENDSLSDVASNDNLEDFDVCTEENNHSNRESLSFELLSKTPSPAVSIYIDEDHFSTSETAVTPDKNGNDCTTEPLLDRDDLYEDHFSTNENNATSDDNGNDNANQDRRNVLYIVDINGKVYNEYLPTDSDPCVNLEKRPTGAYSFIGETLPANPKESVHLERRAESACDLNTEDVKSSHASYPEGTENVNKRADVPLAQRCYQSQSDMGEFGQSFHSHTTSTRNDDVYASSEVHASTSYKYRQASSDRAASKDAAQSDFQQTGRKNDKEKGARASRHEDESYGRRTDNGRCFGSHQGANRGRVDAQRAPVALGSEVHILPESLVAGAAHVAFIAYGTAREVFKRVRAHTVVFYEILPT